jgi:hypothetical protein
VKGGKGYGMKSVPEKSSRDKTISEVAQGVGDLCHLDRNVDIIIEEVESAQ